MNRRKRQTSINSFIAFLSLTVLSAFGLMVFFQYQNLKGLDQEINSLNDQLEERTRLFVEIQQTLGYGGVIHNLKDYIIRRDARYSQTALGKIGLAKEYLRQYGDLDGISDTEKQQLNVIIEMVRKYQQVVDYISTNDLDDLSALELDALVQIDDTRTETALESLKESYEEFAQLGRAQVLDLIFLSFITLIGIIGGSLLVVIIISVLVILALRKRTAEILTVTDKIGAGDLRQLIGFESRDFMGRLAKNFDTAITSFREIIVNIRTSVGASQEIAGNLKGEIEETIRATKRIKTSIAEVGERIRRLNQKTEGSSAAADEIRATIVNLAKGIENQVSAVTETSASIEEMAASIKNVAGVAQTRMRASQVLSQITDQGAEQVRKTDSLITGVSSAIDDMQAMIEVIENVTSQTDMLSMNAAIEAAHAGEAGKGFAVVADEIRKLAESTRENSKEISGRLQEIIESIKDALDASRSTSSAFNTIRNGVSSAMDAFTEISNSTQELSAGTQQILSAVESLMDISGEIKSGSEEMSSGAGEISDALRAVNQIADEVKQEIGRVSGNAEEIASTAESISRLGEANVSTILKLTEQVADFRLEEEEEIVEADEEDSPPA